MANVSISGSGHNSTITLYAIHQGNGSFRKDTSTTHSQVTLMQQALTNLGYNTQGADGKFGNNTLAAVKAFQSAKGLTVDGYFGKNSLLALETAIGGHLDPDNCETSSSGGNNTDIPYEFTDDVNTNPTVTKYYNFDPALAVAYAIKHSSNTNKKNGNKVADPKRNTSFGEGATGACANFVHQCLLAGGARMFDGWCYKLNGIPNSWDSSTWKLTNKGRRKLLEKHWMTRITNLQDVKAGDIIYTYYSDYKKRGLNTPYNHVTIAIEDYNKTSQTVQVCGHTENQNNKPKKLSATGVPCTYCYRIKTMLGGDGTEKDIDLTPGQSKAK